jgi:hypothetical protein
MAHRGPPAWLPIGAVLARAAIERGFSARRASQPAEIHHELLRRHENIF